MRAPPDNPSVALAAYTQRIGAEQCNFRCYIIREQERELYHHDRYVTLAADGAVTRRKLVAVRCRVPTKPTKPSFGTRLIFEFDDSGILGAPKSQQNLCKRHSGQRI
jgi:hypothetical protein